MLSDLIRLIRYFLCWRRTRIDLTRWTRKNGLSGRLFLYHKHITIFSPDLPKVHDYGLPCHPYGTRPMWIYSETCLKRPPLGARKSGRYNIGGLFNKVVRNWSIFRSSVEQMRTLSYARVRSTQRWFTSIWWKRWWHAVVSCKLALWWLFWQ